jgi:hypothetical protein
MVYNPTGPYGTFTPPGIPDPNLVALQANLLNLPTPKGPVQAQKKMSLWDRVQQFGSPYPDHLAGLVNERDVQGARNQGLLALGASLLESSGPSTTPIGLGQAIGRGIQAGQQGYQGSIDRLTQGAAARQELDMNKMKMEGFKQEQEKLAQITAKRQAVLKAFPMPGSGNMEDMEQWIAQTMPHFVEMGDEDTVRSLTEAYKTIAAQKGGQNSKWYEVDKGDYIEMRDPKTNKIMEVVKKGIAPRDVAAGLDTRRQMQEQRDAQREGMLADDYFGRTKEIAEVAGFASVLNVSGEAALSGDAAAQMSVLYAIMKLNDPGSAVKEGEYAKAEDSAGVPEQLRNAYNKVQQGGSIPPEAIQRFLTQGNRMAGSWQRKLKVYQDHFKKRAVSQKINPDHVIIDYFSGMTFDGPAVSTQGASVPGAGGSNVKNRIGGIR